MTTQTGRRRAVRGAAVAVVAAGLTIGLSTPAALADPASTASATPTPTAPAPGLQTAGTPSAQTAGTAGTQPGTSGTSGTQPSTSNSGVPQFTNADQLLLYIDQEYDTGAGGGQLSNLTKAVMKLRAAGYRPSKQNVQAIIAALDERPNQKPLIEALNETLGYQQKIKAQNEMLQQAAAAKNGQNSAVMGAGQMPSAGAPAAPAPAPAPEPVAPPAPSP